MTGGDSMRSITSERWGTYLLEHIEVTALDGRRFGWSVFCDTCDEEIASLVSYRDAVIATQEHEHK